MELTEEQRLKLGRIKALLFDKDGTLIDFEKTWKPVTMALALRAAKGDAKKAQSLLRLGGYDVENDRYEGDSLLAAGAVSDIVSMWHPGLDEKAHADEVSFYREYCAVQSQKHVVAIEGMERTLDSLKSSGYILGIGTNDSHHGAKSCMEFLGCVEYFDVILGYDSVENPKPAGDQIITFAEKAGLDVDQVAMIGDNGLDMEAAKRGCAGMAIAVLSGNGTLEQLKPYSDLVLDTINELPRLLVEF